MYTLNHGWTLSNLFAQQEMLTLPYTEQDSYTMSGQPYTECCCSTVCLLGNTPSEVPLISKASVVIHSAGASLLCTVQKWFLAVSELCNGQKWFSSIKHLDPVPNSPQTWIIQCTMCSWKLIMCSWNIIAYTMLWSTAVIKCCDIVTCALSHPYVDYTHAITLALTLFVKFGCDNVVSCISRIQHYTSTHARILAAPLTALIHCLSRMRGVWLYGEGPRALTPWCLLSLQYIQASCISIDIVQDKAGCLMLLTVAG